MVRRLVRALAKGLMIVSLVSSTFSHTASAGWETQWIDPFDGSGVNWSNWTAQTQASFNNEIQCYTDDDSSANRNFYMDASSPKFAC